jgi:hypothetical protein
MSTSENLVKVTPSQARRIIEKTLDFNKGKPGKKKQNILIVGPSGTAKSAVCEQIAEDRKMHLFVGVVSIQEPTDVGGLPFKHLTLDGREIGKHLLFEFMDKIVQAKEEALVVLEEVGQAPFAVQAAWMHPIWAREINGHQVSEFVNFIILTNSREDQAGVQGIISTLSLRCQVMRMEPSAPDFIEWGKKRGGINPYVLAYVDAHPRKIHVPNPNRDMINFPCPRTWEFVSNHLYMELEKRDQFPAIAGDIGDAEAQEFIGWMRISERMPHWRDIVRDPMNAPIPAGNEAGILYALCITLSRIADKDTWPAIYKYSSRISKEYQTWLINETILQKPELMETSEFIKWAGENHKIHIRK